MRQVTRERARVRAVKVDNLRGILGVKTLDETRNEIICEKCGLVKNVDSRIMESMLRSHTMVQ